MDVKSPHMFWVDFLCLFGVVATGLIGNAQLADFDIQTLGLSFKILEVCHRFYGWEIALRVLGSF